MAPPQALSTQSSLSIPLQAGSIVPAALPTELGLTDLRDKTPTRKSRPRRQALTPRQQRFVQHYFLTPTATQAALAAGYSPPSADKIAHQLLEIPRVQAALAAMQERLARQAHISAERILREEKAIALADPAGLFDERGGLRPLAQWPPSLCRAISRYEISETVTKRGRRTRKVRIEFWDKGRALERLERLLGITQSRPESPETSLEERMRAAEARLVAAGRLPELRPTPA